jgi:hypothetical protein
MPFRIVRVAGGRRKRGQRGKRGDAGRFRVAKPQCRDCKGVEEGIVVCLKRNNSLVFSASEVRPASIESSCCGGSDGVCFRWWRKKSDLVGCIAALTALLQAQITTL